MTGLRTILIAIDASDEAEEVLEAAASIDPRCGLDYRVITVVPPMVGGVSGIDGMSFAAAWPLREMEESVVRQSAENIRERVAAYGIEPKSVSVGSHGRHGVKGALLGSTANGVLHNSPCDVLTVRISTVSETAPS